MPFGLNINKQVNPLNILKFYYKIYYYISNAYSNNIAHVYKYTN